MKETLGNSKRLPNGWILMNFKGVILNEGKISGIQKRLPNGNIVTYFKGVILQKGK